MLDVLYIQNYLILSTLTISNILITGASGLIGTRLTELLLQKGYRVSHLGRKAKSGNVPSFVWDVGKQTMDEKALKDIGTIIHLAGAGIADKRWTASRKKEIVDSRVNATKFLFTALSKGEHSVKNFISASAIGYYGFGWGDEVFTEESQAGSDYLATVTKAWEEEVDKLNSLSLRVAKLRIGIVLSEKGGALKSMVAPIQYFAGAHLGSGQQQISWIHIDDLCSMFIHLLENENLRGAFNATGPYAISNAELTKQIANAIHKPLFLPNIPAFVLKAILGEMADMVVRGSTVSSRKIQESGFQFQFPNLTDALSNLLNADHRP
jgi:uncharacterized protein